MLRVSARIHRLFTKLPPVSRALEAHAARLRGEEPLDIIYATLPRKERNRVGAWESFFARLAHRARVLAYDIEHELRLLEALQLNLAMANSWTLQTSDLSDAIENCGSAATRSQRWRELLTVAHRLVANGPSMAWLGPIEDVGAGGDESSAAFSLDARLADALDRQREAILREWGRARAVELVLADVAAQVGGKDLVHAETREVLAGARERLRELVEHLPGDRLPLVVFQNPVGLE